MRMRCLLAGILVCMPAPAFTQEGPVDFDRQIRPILSENCFACHGPDAKQRKADLRLDTKEGAFSDLGGHFAIVAGKSGQSELFKRVSSKDREEVMPPPKTGKKLAPAQIALLKRWIDEGAAWRAHWSFETPRRPEPPRVKNAAAVRNPIDAFVVARLEREGLVPSREADRATLLRRASLDLTGLPPTPAEADALLADPAPDAFEKAVDRLLASPRYGVHMAWPWLNAARYADTNGYQGDSTRTMWPWRDWVIDALNANMPFDRFTVEQIAGDLLPQPTIRQKIATGFNRNHMLNGEGGRIAEESRVDYVADRVDTTATVWLGLTAGCARCHDHKYDPITQKEFYQLYAYFNNLPESGGVDRRGSANPVLELPTPEQTEKIAAQKKAVQEIDQKAKEHEQQLRADQAKWEAAADPAKLPEDLRPLLKVAETQRDEKKARALTDFYLAADPERKRLQGELDKAKKAQKAAEDAVVLVMIMEERPKVRDSFVLIRGAYDKHGEKVGPGIPASLPALPPDAPKNRLALAQWLVDPGNPLTARVTVNRFWQHFFGAGLVKSVEDFGVQGERPSHPELLDWLATEFIRSGWDVKALHRLMVTSATYRQSSSVSPALLERDPENRLLARGARFRLPSHVLRDQALAVSGLLVEKMGGPSVKPYQPPGIWEEATFGQIRFTQGKGEDLYRRSLYTFWRRIIGPPNLFDNSARQVCTVRQSRTNTPLHALTMMNDVTYVEAARALGQRMMKEAGPNVRDRVTLAFRSALARPPRPLEVEILEGSYRRLHERYAKDREAAAKYLKSGESPRDPGLDAAELAACAGVASVILNLDEAITRE